MIWVQSCVTNVKMTARRNLKRMRAMEAKVENVNQRCKTPRDFGGTFLAKRDVVIDFVHFTSCEGFTANKLWWMGKNNPSDDIVDGLWHFKAYDRDLG